MADLPIRRFELGPLTIDEIDRATLIEAVTDAVAEGRGASVVYVNAHGVKLMLEDPAYARDVRGADVVFCDGFGAMLGLRWLGAHVAERMTPPDFVDALLLRVHAAGSGAYFLGDEPGVAELAASALPESLRGVVRGTHHGFFAAEEEARILEEVAESGARLILVGTGMPRQEAFIRRAQQALPGRVWFGVGALFRWMGGVEQRGPRWATDHGLEWAFRLLSQPRRVAHRYLVGLPVLALRLGKLKAEGARFVCTRSARDTA